MRYPNTIDKNIYLSYISKENVWKDGEQILDAINLNWDLNYPESLVELCIKTIAENWNSKYAIFVLKHPLLLQFSVLPIFKSILVRENRALLADIIDFENLQLSDLSSNIKVNALWRRMYGTKWSMISNHNNRPWIELYMEKYLAEMLENLRPVDYNVDKMKNLIELCSPFVKCLTIDHLEAGPHPYNDNLNDHIPFDIILENLNELKSLSITYDCRSIGTHFYLTCTNISDNDITKFTRGLCHTDLREFRFHSSKLEAPMLQIIGRALEKNAALVDIKMENCRFGDAGLHGFCSILTHDSLPNVKHITLSNNFISADGAALLANILRRRKIETLDMKLNPILTEGANEILAIANVIGLVSLSISSCSFDEGVGDALLHVIKFNKTMRKLNVSINKLSEELGLKIAEGLEGNDVIRELDIRGTSISHKTKQIIDGMILENREKNNKVAQCWVKEPDIFSLSVSRPSIFL